MIHRMPLPRGRRAVPRQRRLPLATAAVVALLAGSSPARGHAEYRQIPVVRHTMKGEIAAPPAAVWAQLTKGKNLVTWCPVWKSPANAKVVLAKVGDVLDYTDEYGNGGRSVVTYLVPNKEIRVAHEPNDGSYVCQARLVLTPRGKGTEIEYVEQYTDESAPADLEATAKKMEAEMSETLAALKKGAEGR
jgi:uncharacterized protein YndB with AHSA1/START domain